MSVETEIKLQLLRNFGERSMRAALHAAMKADLPRAVSRRMRSIYFDTEEGELAARRISVRLRQIGERWVQTVKAPAEKKIGLQAYQEAETAVTDSNLDLSLVPWPTRDVAWLVARQVKLRSIFETDIFRTTWQLVRGESKVELAWDRGHIRAGGQEEPVNELELELKAGSPDTLFALAQALAEGLPVRVGHATKAERGVSLAAHTVLAPQRAGILHLSGDESAAIAFRKIAEECVSHMQANERAILAGAGAEAIHQFRVALRRLRAAAGTFRNLIDEQTFERWSRELRWMHQAFGRARDLDVLTTETLSRLATQYPTDAGLRLFTDIAGEARKAARENALQAIDSRRYTLMLLEMARAFNGDSWGRRSAAATSAVPVLDFAREQLQRRYKRVQKLGDRWPDLEIADLHRLRILVKKLRYVVLAFSTLFPVKASHNFFTGLEKLQDCLGALNDASVGQQYVNELAAVAEKENSLAAGEVERAVGLLSGWHARGIEESRQHFAAGWSAFKAHKRFWK